MQMLMKQFNQAIRLSLDRVWETQRDAIREAAGLISAAVLNGKNVHVFDTGHIIDSELIDRAGGLALLRRLRYTFDVDSTAREGDRGSVLSSQEGLSAYVLRKSKAVPGDVLIIGSVSGKTVPVVDMALEAKRMGVAVIAVTAAAYSSALESEHSSGLRLYEAADLVIDNCACYGDAMLELETGERFGPSSGIAAAYVMWCLSACIAEKLQEAGVRPTVFQSVNRPGGWEEYRAQVERYQREGY